MLKLAVRWLVAIIALGITVWIVPEISVEGDGQIALAVTAVILGLLNATVRPILRLLSLPLTAMTLGLFLFVINGVTLWLAAWIAENVFDAGLVIDELLPAILGSIFVCLVSTGLSFLLSDDEKS